jgi:putative transposase
VKGRGAVDYLLRNTNQALIAFTGQADLKASIMITEMGPGREANDFGRGRRSPVRVAGPSGAVTPWRDDLTVGYRSTNKTVYSAKYHVIWCPRYRRRVLAGRVEVRLGQIVARVVDEAGGEVIEVEVMPDDGHLVAEVLPTMVLSRLGQSVKGRSWRMLRSEYPALGGGGVLWSPWWLVSAVGGGPLGGVRRYVENQTVAG